ncbi:DUF4249 family protein [Aureispira sp. CCB-E]|uniref:DUF4249 family protein n=1 Tax=Aureispira sp. CCB-E TaxID=3051121 RepID=UPI0028688846|nr:DUF4249 family protein [Aureispira sp. CCB-E]WMX12581.1 DUF4249 family protein [Aureispira sp. CCB-E]
MRKVLLFSSLVFLAFLSYSCEKEINLKAQTPPGQLYANSILNPDSVFRVFISYSTAITAPLNEIEDRLTQAIDAVVVIKDDNGAIIDTLEFIQKVYSGINSSFLVFESIEGLRPLPSQTYELYVSEPAIKNSKIISAQATLPTSFAPIYAKKRNPRRVITGTDQTFAIDLAWEDPNPQQENLFIIEATYRNIDWAWGFPELAKSELYSIASENDNEEIGPANGKFFYIFIDDNKLRDRQRTDSIFTRIGVLTHTFDQWVDYGNPFSSELLIHVHHVSEDLYDYYQDVEKYRINSSGTDIFAQPVPVRGNVQGGLGILGTEIVQEAVLIYQ